MQLSSKIKVRRICGHDGFEVLPESIVIDFRIILGGCGTLFFMCGAFFDYFLDTVLASLFRGSPGLSQSQRSAFGGGD